FIPIVPLAPLLPAAGLLSLEPCAARRALRESPAVLSQQSPWRPAGTRSRTRGGWSIDRASASPPGACPAALSRPSPAESRAARSRGLAHSSQRGPALLPSSPVRAHRRASQETGTPPARRQPCPRQSRVAAAQAGA